MRSSRTRFWTLGLVSAVTLALILAGCEEPLTPTLTLPPTSTAIPTLTAAPMSTAVPTLTPAPTTTPVPMPTPVLTLEPKAGLLAKLFLIPAQFIDEGVWYGDMGRAWEIAGLQAPRSRVDITQSDSVRDAYNEARRGIVLAPGFLGGVFAASQSGRRSSDSMVTK